MKFAARNPHFSCFNIARVILAGACSASIAFADGRGESSSSKETPRASIRTGQTNDESLSAARGHFARARALLISAVREFDAGASIYAPDALINSDAFRQGVVAKAQELERVIDPQPRQSSRGSRYVAEPSLLKSSGETGK